MFLILVNTSQCYFSLTKFWLSKATVFFWCYYSISTIHNRILHKLFNNQEKTIVVNLYCFISSLCIMYTKYDIILSLYYFKYIKWYFLDWLLCTFNVQSVCKMCLKFVWNFILFLVLIFFFLAHYFFSIIFCCSSCHYKKSSNRN